LSDVADSVETADTVTSVPDYAAQTQESAQATADAPLAGVDVFTNISEALSADAATFAGVTLVANLDDSATGLVTLDTNSDIAAQVTEEVLAQTQIDNTAAFQAAVIEIAQAQASVFAAGTFIAAILEQVVGFDDFFGRELWEDIDDTQLTDWTDILQPTTIEDILVFGGANFGVLSYAGNFQQRYNPNPAVWNEVDDTQDPGWTDIVAV
jgi:hypothetical protein